MNAPDYAIPKQKILKQAQVKGRVFKVVDLFPFQPLLQLVEARHGVDHIITMCYYPPRNRDFYFNTVAELGLELDSLVNTYD